MARKKDTNQATIEAVLAELKGHLEGSSTGLMDRFGTAAADRASRLERSSARMAEAVGEQDPRVVRLRQRAELVSAVTTRIERAKQRVTSTAPLRPHEWMVHGRVERSDGFPLEGMRVRVFDRDRGEDDLLGDEITGHTGEFRAIYHLRDFQDEGENHPDLSVMVSDRTGKVVFISEQPVRPSGGRATYVQIILSPERLEHGVPRTRCAAKTAKGTRCKNLAEPGGDYCHQHRPEDRRASSRVRAD